MSEQRSKSDLSNPQTVTSEARNLHPLGLELLVNCADCGRILNAEVCTHGEQAFSKDILITVERCKCENVPQF